MPGACCIGTAANVRPAVEQDFEKAGDSGIMNVRERFCLDLSDEEAVKEETAMGSRLRATSDERKEGAEIDAI